MELFKVILGKDEFKVVGIANVGTGEVKFQGILNNIPFCENKNYERVRSQVVRAVEINTIAKEQMN